MRCKILQVTLWIYATALMRAFDCVRKNLVVSLAPLAYSLVLSAAGHDRAAIGNSRRVSARSCEPGVHQLGALSGQKYDRWSGKTDFNDFARGFTVYPWDSDHDFSSSRGIPMRLGRHGVGDDSQRPHSFISAFKSRSISCYNPVPELIYQSRTSGLEFARRKLQFHRPELDRVAHPQYPASPHRWLRVVAAV